MRVKARFLVGVGLGLGSELDVRVGAVVGVER